MTKIVNTFVEETVANKWFQRDPIMATAEMLSDVQELIGFGCDADALKELKQASAVIAHLVENTEFQVTDALVMSKMAIDELALGKFASARDMLNVMKNMLFNAKDDVRWNNF